MNSALRRRRRRVGVCLECGGARTDKYLTCTTCRNTYNTARRKRRARAAAKGERTLGGRIFTGPVPEAGKARGNRVEKVETGGDAPQAGPTNGSTTAGAKRKSIKTLRDEVGVRMEEIRERRETALREVARRVLDTCEQNPRFARLVFRELRNMPKEIKADVREMWDGIVLRENAGQGTGRAAPRRNGAKEPDKAEKGQQVHQGSQRSET